MNEKLVQLKKKGGGGGTDKNLCFCFGGTSLVYYDTDMFSSNGSTLTALKDISITVTLWVEGYGNASQYSYGVLNYGTQNITISHNISSSYKYETHNISISAGTTISFSVSPYASKANCLAYLTE